MTTPGPILVATTSFPRFPGDPSGHFVAAEAKLLAAGGQAVVVAAAGHPSAPVELPYDVRWLGGSDLFAQPGALARLQQRPSRALLVPVVARRLSAVLTETDPAHVEAHWLQVAWWLARKGRRCSMTAIAHGSDVSLLRRLPQFLRCRMIEDLRRAGVQLRFVSERLKQHLAGSLSGALRDFVLAGTVRPAALDLPTPGNRMKLRRKLGLDDGLHHAVVVGRLVASKRVAVALRAATLVEHLRVHVIGDGPARASLARRFPEAHFVGACTHPAALDWIAAADLLLSASRTEGAPTVVREARQLGTPVVSADSSDLQAWSSRDSELWVVA